MAKRRARARRKAFAAEPPRGDWQALERRTRWLPWAVVAITIFVFLPAVGHDFVNWDDDRNFLDNPHYRGLSLEHLAWMFTTSHLGHYHPLTWLSLGLDYALWGMDPAGYHFTNIVLHAATALLVYFLILHLLQAARGEDEAGAGLRFAAAFGALLFAIHPLRVESVAWVSERRDVLSGLFYVGAVLLYVRGRLAASIAAFAAALLSKVIVASLPIVLLVIDLYPLRRKLEPRLILNKLPYFALALAAGLVALGQQRLGVSGTFADVDISPLLRVTMSLYGLAFYLWKTVVPLGLYPQYVYSTDPQPFDPPLAVAAVAVVAITAAVIFFRRRFPAALAAWVCYVVTLLPVLSILRLDPQQYVADHHSYLATLGFAALAAGLFHILFDRRQAPIAAGLAAVITFVLCERTIQQISVWENSRTLWTYTLAGSPLSIVAHNNLGRTLAAAGETDPALEHFRRAVAIRPGYAHAQYNLGNLLMREGRLQEAEKHLRLSLEREPNYSAAHNDLGNCLARQGKTAEAEQEYREALRIEPDSADAHYNLALTLHRQEKVDEASDHYRTATRLDPRNADAHNNWGVLLESRGDVQTALEHYRRALEIEPDHADALRNLRAAENR